MRQRNEVGKIKKKKKIVNDFTGGNSGRRKQLEVVGEKNIYRGTKHLQRREKGRRYYWNEEEEGG